MGTICGIVIDDDHKKAVLSLLLYHGFETVYDETIHDVCRTMI